METERLTIRRMVAEDFGAFIDLATIPEVKESAMIDLSHDREKAQEQLAALPHQVLVVSLKDSPEIIGAVCAVPGGDGIDEYEISYLLSPRHWGKGYATEAAKALVVDCFGRLKAKRVIAKCRPDNLRSMRVAMRAGLRHVHTGRVGGKIVSVWDRWKEGVKRGWN